jgi:hypothetical protein
MKGPASARQLHGRLPVHPGRFSPRLAIRRQIRSLRRLPSAVVEHALVRRSRLILNPQDYAVPLQALQGCLDHVGDPEHAGQIAPQILVALLHRRVPKLRAVNR